MATTLFYVRHGRAVSNLVDEYYDDSDEPLIAQGRLQAWETGQSLKNIGVKFDAVYCSPYRRAKETCQIALHSMQMANHYVRYDERLVERNFKGLYGQQFSDDLNHLLYDYTSECSEQYGVETLERLEDRARWFMRDVRARYPNGNILVFSHGALGLAYRAVVNGRPESGSLYDFNLLKNGEVMKLVLK